MPSSVSTLIVLFGRIAVVLLLLAEDAPGKRRGCEILLRRLADGTFSGGTLGRLCLSVHRGAAYATSEVTVSASKLVSGDRGFDAAGSQV